MRKLAVLARGAPNYNARIGRRVQAVGASIPAPVEGWDATSPRANMPPKRAEVMDNWFPQPGWVELRRGNTEHSDLPVSTAVETLAAYQGESTSNLFAASGSVIYDVSSSGAGVSSHTGMANARYQFVNIATTGGNFLWMCNGADIPIYWNGAAWAQAVITVITSTEIVNVVMHKTRLWLTRVNNIDAAYLPTDSIQGAATVFPLGGLFKRGGFLMAIGTWTVDAGAGPEDYIAFVTSRGQVAVYNGTDPASNYVLVGVYDIGAPLGRRCLRNIGSDLAIICIDGVIPLSKIMVFERGAIAKVTLTERIMRVMNASARAYQNNFGWQLITYPRNTSIYLNVPLSAGDIQEQYVMNTLHGAWCRFTGMNANCWEVYNDKLYWGSNDGFVYLTDDGGADPTADFEADMRTAFNYFGDRGRLKRWMMARGLWTTDREETPGMAFNVDYREDAEIIPVSVSGQVGALWDVGLWDVAMWAGGEITEALWQSVTGLGYCASVRFVATVNASAAAGEVILRLNSIDLTYEKGEFV